MKNRGGYLLLDSIISLALTSTLILILSSLLLCTINARDSIEDKIELQQQAAEISKHIEAVIGDSMGILDINTRQTTHTNNKILNNATSIKCKYRDDSLNLNVKDKEISLKSNNSKLFINTINKHGVSESGGYEIGAYIDNMYIGMSNDNKCANIKLELSKGRQTYETEFKVYIRNFKGEDI